MEFSEDTKNRAFMRSGLRCECTSLACGHVTRCGKALYRGNWHAAFKIPVSAGGDNSLCNCEIICTECNERRHPSAENIEKKMVFSKY